MKTNNHNYFMGKFMHCSDYFCKRCNDEYDRIKNKSKVYQKHQKPCSKCGITENLTVHHLKDLAGRKTGKVEILCRKCHDHVEKQYAKLGIVSPQKTRDGGS